MDLMKKLKKSLLVILVVPLLVFCAGVFVACNGGESDDVKVKFEVQIVNGSGQVHFGDQTFYKSDEVKKGDPYSWGEEVYIDRGYDVSGVVADLNGSPLDLKFYEIKEVDYSSVYVEIDDPVNFINKNGAVVRFSFPDSKQDYKLKIDASNCLRHLTTANFAVQTPVYYAKTNQNYQPNKFYKPADINNIISPLTLVSQNSYQDGRFNDKLLIFSEDNIDLSNTTRLSYLGNPVRYTYNDKLMYVYSYTYDFENNTIVENPYGNSYPEVAAGTTKVNVINHTVDTTNDYQTIIGTIKHQIEGITDTSKYLQVTGWTDDKYYYAAYDGNNTYEIPDMQVEGDYNFTFFLILNEDLEDDTQVYLIDANGNKQELNNYLSLTKQTINFYEGSSNTGSKSAYVINLSQIKSNLASLDTSYCTIVMEPNTTKVTKFTFTGEFYRASNSWLIPGVDVRDGSPYAKAVVDQDWSNLNHITTTVLKDNLTLSNYIRVYIGEELISYPHYNSAMQVIIRTTTGSEVARFDGSATLQETPRPCLYVDFPRTTYPELYNQIQSSSELIVELQCNLMLTNSIDFGQADQYEYPFKAGAIMYSFEPGKNYTHDLKNLTKLNRNTTLYVLINDDTIINNSLYVRYKINGDDTTNEQRIATLMNPYTDIFGNSYDSDVGFVKYIAFDDFYFGGGSYHFLEFFYQ